jgi:hypothetical protein
MQTFDELPRSTQIRRIRRLADVALTAYDLEVIRIMGHTLWLAAHIGEPAFGAKAALRVAYQVTLLKDLLKRSCFQTF